jgi:hypothetical protein
MTDFRPGFDSVQPAGKIGVPKGHRSYTSRTSHTTDILRNHFSPFFTFCNSLAFWIFLSKKEPK